MAPTLGQVFTHTPHVAPLSAQKPELQLVGALHARQPWASAMHARRLPWEQSVAPTLGQVFVHTPHVALSAQKPELQLAGALQARHPPLSATHVSRAPPVQDSAPTVLQVLLQTRQLVLLAQEPVEQLL